MIEIKVDKASLQLSVLDPMNKFVQQAAVRAANRTVTSCRSQVKKEASEKLGVKQKDINSRLYMEKAKTQRLVAALRLRGIRVPLIAFAARKRTVRTERGRRIGVTALVAGKREFIPQGFIATMPSGKVGVFRRKSEKQLPITQMFSSDLTNLLNKDGGFLSRLEAYAREVFNKNFINDFKFFSSKG